MTVDIKVHTNLKTFSMPRGRHQKVVLSLCLCLCLSLSQSLPNTKQVFKLCLFPQIDAHCSRIDFNIVEPSFFPTLTRSNRLKAITVNPHSISTELDENKGKELLFIASESTFLCHKFATNQTVGEILLSPSIEHY